MNNDQLLRRFARISLVLFFFVILAGSIVRTTGSGMGCPDWPRCFGYLVPPTSIDPLLFQPAHSYGHGQMVVHSDTLWVANEAFVSAKSFDRTKWHKYPKHDYAIFNPVQTWIEYINRLATAVFAIPVLLMTFFAFRRWRRQNDLITLLFALGSVFMIGFEAWLGKLVVDGNLKTSSVTLHMVGSLAIILCIVALLQRNRIHRLNDIVSSKATLMVWTGLVCSLVQIMLGTQVREETDVIAQATSDRSQWIEMMSALFYVHRSFSILIVLLTACTWWLLRRSSVQSWGNALLALIGVEILAGIILAYFDMPAWMQPLHLLFAVMWFALSAYLVIRIRTPKSAIAQH
jgi:cytochrome c oxidase assembly protein subunit 15